MAKKTKAKTQEVQASRKDHSILIKPVVTEKSATIGGANFSGAVFKVDGDATKLEIKGAIERIFNVQVASVRTCNYLGKVKRTGRSMGRRSNYKKAMITLKPGFQLNLIEGV